MFGIEKEEIAVRSQAKDGNENPQQQQLHHDQDMFQHLNDFREAMEVREDQGMNNEYEKAQAELTMYKAEPCYNPLEWWKYNSRCFPN
jgi:hypothetical protein